jgi:catechol 2,3-dioxygenase-like lactoylglutathione lyase family enzyme
MAWELGTVGHFGLAVRDPKKSARWWIDHLKLKHQFDFDGGVAIGNDAFTLALHEGVPHPGTLGHMSFHLHSMHALNEALADLKAAGIKLEDPGDEIGPEAPGSKNMGLWFHDPDGYRWELNVQHKA